MWISPDDEDLPEEDPRARLNRNFNELLQELPVAQTGVQILFAFLLTLAFTQRFAQATTFQKVVYVLTLLAAAGATALMIGPVSYHRVAFRRGRKPEVLRTADRWARGGLALVLVAMVGAVLLVIDVVAGRWVAVVLAALTATWFVVLWYVIPLWRRSRWTDQK